MKENPFVQLNLSSANPSAPVLVDCEIEEGKTITHACAFIRAEAVIMVQDREHHIISGATPHAGVPSEQKGVNIHAWCDVYLRGYPHSITLPFPAAVLMRALELR